MPKMNVQKIALGSAGVISGVATSRGIFEITRRIGRKPGEEFGPGNKVPELATVISGGVGAALTYAEPTLGTAHVTASTAVLALQGVSRLMKLPRWLEGLAGKAKANGSMNGSSSSQLQLQPSFAAGGGVQLAATGTMNGRPPLRLV